MSTGIALPEAQPAAGGRLRLGTSGYQYADWHGPFYPVRLPARDQLAYYAGQFNTVELNFTYYRLPTAAGAAGMLRQTPPGFDFFVKAHRSFTHEQDLGAADEFLFGIEPLRAANRLAGLLLQFPQAFANTSANRYYLRQIGRRFQGLRLAVEFRQRAWARQPVFDFLADQALTLVAVDEPALPALFPRLPVVTNPELAYVRFHSRNAAKWYRGGEERYDYRYSGAELRDWVPLLRTITARARKVFVYFNNCHSGQAAQNAREMAAIVAAAGLNLDTAGRWNGTEPLPGGLLDPAGALAGA